MKSKSISKVEFPCEIGERTPDAIEHAVRFVLRPPKHTPNARTNAVKRSVFSFFIARLLSGFALGLDVVHVRPGKHSFGAADVSAISADVDRAHRAPGLRVQRHDPGRIAAFICPQSVTGSFKSGSGLVRRMTSDGKRAARIEI